MINRKELNKKLFIINFKYNKLLLFICKNVISKFPGVPLESSDIYNEFLFTLKEDLSSFDKSKGTLKTFLCTRQKMFAYTLCRKWYTQKHKVLNTCKIIDYDFKDQKNSVKINTNLDTGVLSNNEKIFFKYFFENNLTKKDVMNKMDLTSYSFNKLLFQTKTKVYNHNIKKINV